MTPGDTIRGLIEESASTPMEKVAVALNFMKMCKEYAYFYKEMANSEYIVKGMPKKAAGIDIIKSKVCEINTKDGVVAHQNRTWGVYFDVKKKGTILCEDDHREVENDNPEIVFIDGVPVVKDAFLL